MSGESAFRVTYRCGNCGAEWTTEHPPRTRVEKSTGLGAIAVQNADCEEFVTSNCECCDTVSCPVCALKKGVRVADREPIEEVEDG